MLKDKACRILKKRNSVQLNHRRSKMATGSIHVNKASPSFVCKEDVFCDLQCKSCSFMKGDIQVLVNEMKSMTEIISILKEEL